MDDVDQILASCVNPANKKSFFLFAGAGSGKTHSLINLLDHIYENYRDYYLKNNKQVAVITYTNAATEEILRRLKHSDIFHISTIHSFLWLLIKPYQKEIKEKKIQSLDIKIQEEEQKKRLNQSKIDSYRMAREHAKSVSVFTYNPNGENFGKSSLNHQDIIDISAYFIQEKDLFGRIFIQKFPILLIDESQDTNKDLIDAFFKLQKEWRSDFVLGLIGDVMQRIYSAGKVGLEKALPDDWARVAKNYNYRSSRRVVELGNQIAQNPFLYIEQKPKENADEGYVHFFIADANTNQEKQKIENKVLTRMADITGDAHWSHCSSSENDVMVKKLILEHRMAARRLHFLELFDVLYNDDSTKNGVLDGTLAEIQWFQNCILPIYNESRQSDSKSVATDIMRRYSPLLDKNELSQVSNQREMLKQANIALNELTDLWRDDRDPSFMEVLQSIYSNRTFALPPKLLNLCKEESDTPNLPWSDTAEIPMTQFVHLIDYASGNTEFGTHQGVKGLEFERVMVIIDDEEAKGFLFSYDKLLEVKDKTTADIKNEQAGKDSSIERTRRLFYVTCTRAKESLAIIVYTKSPSLLKNNLIAKKWFFRDEIEII